jgi:hypothetical protein
MKIALSDGSLSIKIRGKVDDIILPLNTKLILKDPKAAMREALKGRKRPRQVVLMVNGFASGESGDSTGGSPYSMKAFFDYIHDELIPFLRRRRKMSYAMIEKIFNVKLVY